MQFQPSEYSVSNAQALDNPDVDLGFAPLLLLAAPAVAAAAGAAYYATSGEDEPPSGGGKPTGGPTADYVEVSDGGATFSIRSNGTIEVITNEYGNEGDVYRPGNATYDTVVQNLTKIGGNKKKLESVLGADAVAKSLSAAPIISSGGSGAAPIVELKPPPFYQHPWFWPAVIITGTVVVGAGILLVPKDKLPWAKATT